jgi:Protein of unknown function (DUF4197)
MKNLTRAVLFALISTLGSSVFVAAQLGASLQRANAALAPHESSEVSEEKIVSGLKEALAVGVSRAIATAGKHDGFMQNEQIRILLPTKLQPVGKGMRMIGMGEQVDDLEIAMNRAAEQATSQAKPVFLAALKNMTLQDARRILTSEDTAATNYFRGATNDEITAAFTPIVHHSMERAGLIKQYARVIKNAPGGGAIANEFDLDKYIVDETLDGIFLLLGEEEQKIRKDPAAQSTTLLREVFGK